MKDFHRLTFDQTQCRSDLAAFRDLLTAKAELEESSDIKPFFEQHPQLALFMGTVFSLERSACDLYSFQYQLFGDFGCDLVVGDSRKQSYLFVEWEAGTANCLFRPQGRKAMPEWTGRFERAFSQLVDWFWKMEDMARTDEYEARFGSRHAEYVGLLVMGRDAELTHPRERNRWHWRSRRVTINGRAVRLVTYDQLWLDLVALFRHMFPRSVI